MSRRDIPTYDDAPDRAPSAARAALDALTVTRLWSNPCWLTARLNILANRFNVPVYGWIEKRFGLSRPEFVVLFSLWLANDLVASQIATSTGFPKNTLSRAINRLVRLKCVVRRADPEDRRSARLNLSAKGRAIVEEAMPRLHRREQELLSPLSAREQEIVSALLAKMVVSLELLDRVQSPEGDD